jgi:hypothetical protein
MPDPTVNTRGDDPRRVLEGQVRACDGDGLRFAHLMQQSKSLNGKGDGHGSENPRCPLTDRKGIAKPHWPIAQDEGQEQFEGKEAWKAVRAHMTEGTPRER